jgi:SAM-dependent methyltransferase
MSMIASHSDLVLGTVGARILRLSPTILHASAEHARRIAASLGSADAESSMAGYWSLASRAQQWQRIVDRIGVARAGEARFVEVGSGLGLFALVGAALGFRVAGVESSSDRYAESINIARALFREHGIDPPIVQAYSEKLPLPDASVDVVASFQTLEHVGNVEWTLREIRRILRPGGLLFAQAPNYTAFYEVHYGILAPLALGKVRVRSLLRLYRRPPGFLDHLQWLDPARLREQLRAAGFATAAVGPIAAAPTNGAALPIVARPSPFRFRRGIRAERLSNRLATASHALGISADRYTQIEVWATA